MTGVAFATQLSLLNKSSNNYQNLKKYIESLQACESNIAATWTKSGNDRYYIFKCLNDIGKELTSIYKGYYSFTGAAKNYVNILKKFEKIVGGITIPGVRFSYKTVNVNKTTSTVIKINTSTVKSEAQKIAKIAQNVGELNLSYKNIAARVDDAISVYLRGRTSSLRDLNKRLDNAAIKLAKVASVLVSICDNYTKTEENIRKKADELKNGRDVTYLDGTISNVIPVGEGGASSIVNYGNSTYAVRIEVGSIAKVDIKSKDALFKWIINRDKQLPKGSNYNGWCGQFVADKLNAAGIKGYGSHNGKDWFGYFKSHPDSGKYHADCYAGKDSITEMVKANGGNPIYNVVVSFGIGNGTGKPYGHVVYIDAIIDGYVYYSESYSVNGSSGPYRKAISDFVSSYNKTYSNSMQGAVHLSAKA